MAERDWEEKAFCMTWRFSSTGLSDLVLFVLFALISVVSITMRLMIIWSVVFTVALQCWIAGAQSNYAERGVDIEYQGNGIPLEATLDGIVTKLDDLTHVIRTNRSVVVINQSK